MMMKHYLPAVLFRCKVPQAPLGAHLKPQHVYCKHEECTRIAQSYLLDGRNLQLSLFRSLWLCGAGHCCILSTPEALQLLQVRSPCPYLDPAQQQKISIV